MDAHLTTEGSKLHDYLRIVRRRKWILLAALVLVPLAALAYAFHQTPKYQASAQVLLNRQNYANSLNGVVDPSVTMDSSRLPDTQAQLARVPEIARATLATLGLKSAPEGLLGESSVSPSTSADILTFRVTDTDRTLAPRLATEYATQYISFSERISTGAIKKAREDVEARIQQLQGEGDTKSALYASLLEKDQQLSTMAVLQTANATLVHPATNSAQVQPQPIKTGVLAIALGFVLGLALVFLREALDTRIRSSADIASKLGLPLIARLPRPSRALRKADQLVMVERPNGPEAEPFRVLRTNLNFVNLERRAKTIMVTSALAGEGKSTTAANLAVAYAQNGQSVVLVDLDLRRPYIDRLFRLGTGPGLTAVALGECQLNDALVRIPLPTAPGPNAALSSLAAVDEVVELGRLQVLTTGWLPPDPGEFTGSAAVAEILESLAERADVVLIDSPPLLNIGDALALTAEVDAIVLVARLKMLRRPMLTELRRLLESVPAKALGFVVTDAESEDGYGYGYGYGYRYGHGGRDGDAEATAGASSLNGRRASKKAEQVR